MSPIQVLENHYVGKRITSAAQDLNEFIGSKILSIQLDSYDSTFIFKLESPDGSMTYVNILEVWNIEVD